MRTDAVQRDPVSVTIMVWQLHLLEQQVRVEAGNTDWTLR